MRDVNLKRPEDTNFISEMPRLSITFFFNIGFVVGLLHLLYTNGL